MVLLGRRRGMEGYEPNGSPSHAKESVLCLCLCCWVCVCGGREGGRDVVESVGSGVERYVWTWKWMCGWMQMQRKMDGGMDVRVGVGKRASKIRCERYMGLDGWNERRSCVRSHW